ncbi:hypothetical protein IAU60_000517 [Kwoniella sp. DSM 27419]
MTTAGPSHRQAPVAPSYHQYRHHPYANSPNVAVKAASSSGSHRANGHVRPTQASATTEFPPSPPRSRRDDSETPSIGLGVAFGGAAGGKWWDEELPPPPASLSSILDSFRKSGEGDRDLLLSILGAKKAEEERLTALIQTRLTILQARLSLHSAAAQLSAQGALPDPASIAPSAIERTPSLTSSRGPGSMSDGIASPPLPPTATYIPGPQIAGVEKGSPRDSRDGRGYWQLPSLQSSLRAPAQSRQSNAGPVRSPNSPSHTGLPLAPIRDLRMEDLERERPRAGRTSGSLSPKSLASDGSQSRRDRSGSGLEMLLDAGRVVNESAERDA